ncbi:MAG: DUF72 domain-containing protein [Salegentibacter sp.]
MKFGKTEHPENVDFSLPPTHKQTEEVLKNSKGADFNVRIGCAKWNRKDLKNFYPRGTKDELSYYSTQFNSIEFNACFYRIFPEEQFRTWYEKAEDDFQFFPKISRPISHLKRLNDAEELVDKYITNVHALKEKLGMVFLQMPENFLPKYIERLDPFFRYWPKEIPLAAEFRHNSWYSDDKVADELNEILMKNNVAHVITDSAGRRDLLHMRLTTPTAFIRYNGANHPSDYTRLDDWLDRIQEWREMGLQNLYFFVHQNVEEASPLLSAYFIEKFNKRFNTQIHIPKTLN